jgi:hypothetical protein
MAGWRLRRPSGDLQHTMAANREMATFTLISLIGDRL